MTVGFIVREDLIVLIFETEESSGARAPPPLPHSQLAPA